MHGFLLKYLGLSKSQNNTLHSCRSDCDDIQSVPHKNLTPNPSDLVKKISEEQCKIRSILLKVLINPKWVIGDSDRAKKVS